jgi:hypothetical protein
MALIPVGNSVEYVPGTKTFQLVEGGRDLIGGLGKGDEKSGSINQELLPNSKAVDVEEY